MRLTKLVQKHIPEVLAKLPSKKWPPPFLCTSLHKSFSYWRVIDTAATLSKGQMLEISETRGLGLVNKLSLIGQVAACPQAIHWCCWIVKTWFNMLTGYDLINLIASGYCIRSEAVTALTALAITGNIYNQMLLNWKTSGLLTTHSCCSHYSCLFNFI